MSKLNDNLNYPLRFESKKMKRDFARICKARRMSLNALINHLMEEEINKVTACASVKVGGVTAKEGMLSDDES